MACSPATFYLLLDELKRQGIKRETADIQKMGKPLGAVEIRTADHIFPIGVVVGLDKDYKVVKVFNIIRETKK